MKLDHLVRDLDRSATPPSATQLLRLVQCIDVSVHDVESHITCQADTYNRSCFWSGLCGELFVMTWGPGQASTIHDHGNSTCAVLVLAGELRENLFVKRGGQLSRISSRRLIEGKRSVLGSAAIHQVVNRTETTAVSLHLYLPGSKANPFKTYECWEDA